MNNDIKEIVVDNDELIVKYKDNSFESFDTLPINVLDYITNLEQEINNAEKSCAYWEERADIAEEKIDKAIEYIEENATYDEKYDVFCDDLRYDDCLDLLNILKGDD